LTQPPFSVRHEQPGDEPAVRDVILDAMRNVEADMVDQVRAHGKAVLSLVAVVDGDVVGHILFSPASFDAGTPELPSLGLAPLAVKTAHQNRGIGSALVREGLEEARRRGYGSVLVLGHPTYYPRFGFRPCSDFGLHWASTLRHPEAFMAIELQPGALDGLAGVAREAEEFGL
jgi:putative acetyltransferase